MATHISASPESTVALGEDFGRRAQAGWIVALRGDLGAGKTQFARGIARGLGATDRVHSPTFALLNEYRTGRLPVYHLDLYRLETPAAIASAGLDEYFSQRDGVTVIEWFERLEAAGQGSIATHVFTFEVVSDNERRIHENSRS